ncbi:MAG: MoaD/ThiS family protein [Candidatus Undinarchaeales archaeon]|jgi:hypothetical protein|nr:MoaD/ThiS family protein [Candidatus Undinarchaeales archaeon]MDP7492187.1 MoaD/ThiS family protein [Candidatus Undinarchaeales archaeon]
MADGMISIALRAVGTLTRLVKPPMHREVPLGTTVRELAHLNGVEDGMVMLVFVNKAKTTFDRVLEDGDEVVLYPIVAGG